MRGLAWLLLPVAIAACDGRGPDYVAPVYEGALAPRLLQDQAEIQAYLEAFPRQEYEVHDVPKVGRFYLDDNPGLVKRQLRRGEPWEPHVVDELGKYVRPGSTVLDVGAHIGSLTVVLARLAGPEGRVYAFEPQKKIFRELVYNLGLNGATNVVPLRFAVSAEPGIIEMTPVRGADGLAQIGRGGDRAEARTLDSFGFDDVSLIKIDVEGYELPVLRGAKRTIEASRPVIIIEIRGSERYESLAPKPRQRVDTTKSTLVEYGYRFHKIGEAISHDYVALYEEDASRRREVR